MKEFATAVESNTNILIGVKINMWQDRKECNTVLEAFHITKFYFEHPDLQIVLTIIMTQCENLANNNKQLNWQPIS